jgi:hypothetical protein
MKNSENVLLRGFFEKFGSNALDDHSVEYCLQNCSALTFTDRMWTHFIDFVLVHFGMYSNV